MFCGNYGALEPLSLNLGTCKPTQSQRPAVCEYNRMFRHKQPWIERFLPILTLFARIPNVSITRAPEALT